MLKVLRESRFYIDDFEKVCLFIFLVDILDCDNFSEDYVYGLFFKVWLLLYWNGGINYIIFNFFLGIWFDYLEGLFFNSGKVILVKVLMFMEFFRFGFDVSFLLFLKIYL